MARPEAPTYQRMGLMTRSLRPATDYAARESIALQQNIITQIDSMYANTVKQAAVEAEYKGTEYGAANPVTLQQIIDSNETGEDPLAKFDTDTIFGRAARASALGVFENELTYEGRTTFAALDQELRAGKVDISEYARRMDAVTAGLSGAAQEASPALAAKIRAELGVTAASYFTSYGAEVQKKQDKQLSASYTIGIASDLNELPNQLQAILNNPALQQDNVTNENIMQLIQTLGVEKSRSITNKALSAEYSSAAMKTLGNEIEAAFTSSLQEFVINKAVFEEDAGEFAYQILKKQPTGNRVVDAIVAQSSDGERRAIFTEIQTLERQRLSDIDAADARLDEQNTERSNQIKGELIISLQAHDPTQGPISEEANFKNMWQELRQIDPGAAADILDKGIKTNFGTNVTDENAKRSLQVAYAQNRLSFDDILDNIDLLSGDDLIDFTDKAQALQSKENQVALSYVAGQIDYDEDAQNVSESDPNYKMSKLYARIKGNIHEASLAAANAGEDFDAMSFAKSELELLDTEISDAIREKTLKAGSNALKSINNQLKNLNMPALSDMQQALDYLEGLSRNDDFFQKVPQPAVSNYMDKLRKALEVE